LEQAEQIDPLYFAQLGSLTAIVTAPPELDPDDVLVVEAAMPVLEVDELEDDDPEKPEPLEDPDDDPELPANPELDPELPANPELDPEAGEQVDPTSTYPDIQAVH
jgi:hypothetical protein